MGVEVEEVVMEEAEEGVAGAEEAVMEVRLFYHHIYKRHRLDSPFIGRGGGEGRGRGGGGNLTMQSQFILLLGSVRSRRWRWKRRWWRI